MTRSLDQVEVAATHRVMIFGPPKSGKTLLAGKLAEKYKLLYIGMENGHSTLFQLPKEWHKRIHVILLSDTKTYPIAAETVLKIVKGKEHKICDEHGKVACNLCRKENPEGFTTINLDTLGPEWVVIWDSATQLSNSIIAHMTKKEDDEYKLTFNDYGNQGRLLDVFFSHIQQSKYNCIVITHDVEAETEGKKKKLVPVAGTRNFSRTVGKYFDHVIVAEVMNKRHTFASSSTFKNTVLTGSRTGVELEAGGPEKEVSLFDIFGDPTNDVQRENSTSEVDKPAEPVKEEATPVQETQAPTPAEIKEKTDTGRGISKLAALRAKAKKGK